VPGQPAPPRPPAGPGAKDFEGLDVFGSDGQQIGRVVKTSETPNGQVKNIEVHSSGFFGFFAKVFMVPADKATIKAGRVELAASSDQAKQWLQ
jgi:ribosomal 30S subunit maturation factor RimM